jgi:glycosyltransferase 2 family protein
MTEPIPPALHRTGRASTTLAAIDRALPMVAAVVATAALAYLAAAWAVGADATWEAAARLGGWGVAAGTLVASATYGVRWWRWRVLLLGGGFGHRLPPSACARIYLAGLALGPTPGKLGETLRSAFLLPHGVKLRESLAAFFGDRLSDVMAMVTLGLLAAAWLGERHHGLELLGAAVVGVAVTARWLGRRLPLGPDETGPPGPANAGSPARASGWRSAWVRRWQQVASPLAAWARVWTLPRAMGCVAAGLLAYATQGLVLAAYVAAVGEALPAARCLLIFATATLLGAASGIPGGLGVMEAALVWQLQQAGIEPGSALAATVLLRLSTLWTAVLIGTVALISLSRRTAALNLDNK